MYNNHPIQQPVTIGSMVMPSPGIYPITSSLNHGASTRAQQGNRLALHERMTPRASPGGETTTAMWQCLPLPSDAKLHPVSNLSQEDVRDGEYLGDGLLAIRTLARHCMSSATRTIFFRQTVKGWAPSKTAYDLIAIFPVLSMFASSRSQYDLCLSPLIRSMGEAFNKVGLSELTLYPPVWFYNGLFVGPAHIANLSNDLGNVVRAWGNSAAGGRALQRHDDEHAVMWRLATAYFAKVARRHPAGHVKRIELEFAPRYGIDNPSGRYRQMHEASGVFVRSVNLRYGAALVADARLIDRDSYGGYQAHVVLVFDGPNVQELEQIDEVLIDVWRTQTSDGHLTAMDAFADFQYRGRGLLQGCHANLAGQLEKTAIYLARTREVVDVHIQGTPQSLIIGEVSRDTKSPAFSPALAKRVTDPSSET